VTREVPAGCCIGRVHEPSTQHVCQSAPVNSFRHHRTGAAHTQRRVQSPIHQPDTGHVVEFTALPEKTFGASPAIPQPRALYPAMRALSPRRTKPVLCKKKPRKKERQCGRRRSRRGRGGFPEREASPAKPTSPHGVVAPESLESRDGPPKQP